MIPIRDILRQETKCYGEINGKHFNLIGGGSGRPFDGVVHTELKSTTGPLHFPTCLLSPVLIMGYPSFSTYHHGAFDLFKLSNGYEYERHFIFDNGGTMDTLHRVQYHGDYLSGDFQVLDASVDIPDIISCDPTIETFIPSVPGVIKSQFVMAWHRKDGGIFTATTRNEYRLTHSLSIPYMQFRYITFDSNYGNEYINQTEKLNVFRDIRKLWFPPDQSR